MPAREPMIRKSSFFRLLRRGCISRASFRALWAGLVTLVAACSGGHGADNGGGDFVLPQPNASLEGGTTAGCVPWSTRECGIELGVRDGVVNCAHGVQICEGGKWGACLIDAARGTSSVKAPAPAMGQAAVDSLS